MSDMLKAKLQIEKEISELEDKMQIARNVAKSLHWYQFFSRDNIGWKLSFLALKRSELQSLLLIYE